MPPLVIVCGPPASGKTALAVALSARFGLPVISKDSFKEAIMDHLGGGEAAGAAAFAVQFAAARTMLRSGVGLILEGAFFAGHEELADVAAMGDCVVLQLSCPIEVIESRFTRRLGSRHPRHRGTEALPELRERVEKGTYIPTLDKPVLKIETSNGLQPNEEEIARWVRGTLSARRTPLHPSDDQPSLREAWDEHAGEWIR